jgi:large subunit ribosomal protein L1
MAKISKNRKAVLAKINLEKEYSLDDASGLVKDITFVKFDSSVDLDIRLGVDPKKSDQMVRGVVALPHGIGKLVRVLVLCTPDKAQDAKDAGAEHVGLDEYIQKN